MHIVLVYRCYNDGAIYYNLTFCTKKSLMTDLGLIPNRSSWDRDMFPLIIQKDSHDD